MHFLPDWVVQNIKLKKSVLFWKSIAIFIVATFLLYFIYINSSVNTSTISYSPAIGRLRINGFIGEDFERDKRILELASNKNIKALIVHVNSQGGSIVGSESLYNTLRTFAQKKKLVVVMDGMAASGGYMVSLAADHIIAHAGTITGSIGVIFQTLDLSEIAKKLGVGINVVRSGELKAIPSMLEKLSDQGRESLQNSLGVAYDFFYSLVLNRRGIDDPKILKEISTGKIFIGSQALAANLVDEIGGESKAIEWLMKNGIVGEVKDIKLYGNSLQIPFNRPADTEWKKYFFGYFIKNQGILAIIPAYLDDENIISSFDEK